MEIEEVKKLKLIAQKQIKDIIVQLEKDTDCFATIEHSKTMSCPGMELGSQVSIPETVVWHEINIDLSV